MLAPRPPAWTLVLLLGCEEGYGVAITDTALYSQVRVADHAFCALREDGMLRCWGEGADAAPTDTELIAFDMQGDHGCAVTAAGEGACWSWRDALQSPLTVPEGPLAAVATGYDSTCWLTIEGQTLCFGPGYYGETEPPPQALGSISGGGGHYCATAAEDGLLTCWGYDSEGSGESVPAIAPLSYDAGSSATCVIDEGGAATCYGISPLFAVVSNPYSPEGTFRAVGADSEPCFIDTDGAADCLYDLWPGCDEPAGPYRAISVANYRVCAAWDEGGILCWMEDPYNVLGGDTSYDPGNCLIGEPSAMPWSE